MQKGQRCKPPEGREQFFGQCLPAPPPFLELYPAQSGKIINTEYMIGKRDKENDGRMNESTGFGVRTEFGTQFL